MANVGKIFELVHIRSRETIIFTMSNNSLYGRVYQEDGKEIDYSKRRYQNSNNASSYWI